MKVDTIGGVLAAGEVIMLIVPENALLMIEAQLPPVEIDRVMLNQQVTVRFPSFDTDTTPELLGSLVHISPDLTIDPRTNAGYYNVQVQINENEIAKIGSNRLVPGMPAQVFAKTENRTVLSFLTKPLTDYMASAMREK
jgi:HlyD family secretion protein